MLKKILLALVLILAALILVVATRPAEFRIARSHSIAAPPGVVFALVNDFHQWNAWSPWAKLDPAMQQTHAGAPAGTGAIYSWAGNHAVGEGRMTITDSRPSELIRIRLEFQKPFAALNTTEFTFAPTGQQTTVTWNMTGTNNFMARAFGLFMNMDKMVGDDFEKGLVQMKVAAEAAAQQP